jgi:hypothetical protein
MSNLYNKRKWYNAYARYKISPIQYFKILLRQDFCCPICKLEFDFLGSNRAVKGVRRACVDHDHLTGEVRGILCSSCNHGMGFFFDSADWINSATNYLKEYSNLRLQKKSDTQVTMVLQYLQKRGPITQATASHVFGCSRLASVIYRLRKRGHEITATYEQGVKGRFARYALQQKKK